MMRVGVDMSILRHPPSGTARYAVEILAALPEALDEGSSVWPMRGFPRARWRSPLRRPSNLAGDLAWLTLGAWAGSARHRIDVWYSPSNILPFGLPRPQVVTIHDVNLLEPGAGYDRGYVRFAAPQFARSARAASIIIADSAFAAGRIASTLGVDPAKIMVAYPGIDHSVVEPPVRSSGDLPERYALFVGRSEPHKNLPLLVRAWSRGTPPDLHLVFAGPAGGGTLELKGSIEASPARARIHDLGPVSEHRLAELYDRAACFLFPSRLEGFGLPPLEAMHRGIPTAVANASCLPEVTAGGAELFDPDDADSVAAAITTLLAPARIERARVEGPRIAARYTWAAAATTIAAALRQAVRGG